MRDTFLKKLAALHTTHPWRMLLLDIFLTIFLIICASNLTVTMRTSDLLPENDPKVVQFNTIIDEFATATNLVIVAQGEEHNIKSFADVLAPRILELKDGEKQLFQRVDYKSEIEFLREHMLLLIEADDLKNTKDMFTDANLVGLLTNLNNSMEKEYVGQSESISTREKEDGAVAFLDGIENLVLTLQKSVNEGNLSEEEIKEAADRLLFGDPYMVSYDKEVLLMIAVPTFTLMDRDLIMTSTAAAQALVDEVLTEYPSIEAGLSGPIAREHDEQTYSTQAIGFTSLIALVIILLLLIISFRMLIAPIFALLTLIFGVVWAMGASWLVVGQLNMFTSMMSVVLLGLGIDFAIHLISSYTEWRNAGDDIATAMEKAFLKSGRGIVTGALTTACAFLTLIISQARGMKEMGIVTGLGLISILAATLLFLPVMLVLKDRFNAFVHKKAMEKRKHVQRDISFRFLGRTGEFLSRHYVFTIASAVLVSLVLAFSAVNITWEEDILSADPKHWISIALMDTVNEKFDLSIEYALVLADNVEESREISEACREFSSVALTNDISLYLPSPEEQDRRIPYIDEIRAEIVSTPLHSALSARDMSVLAAEIDRLEMNIIEMQDMAFLGGQDKVDKKCAQIVGDPNNNNSINIFAELRKLIEQNTVQARTEFSHVQRVFAPYFNEAVLNICSTEPILLQDLPESILDRYSNRDRDKFMITVYPTGDLWHKHTLQRFVTDIERVTDEATGSPLLADSLVKIFGRDGRNAVLLTLVIVFLLLSFDFKSFRYALTAMVPLALGVFWMVGFMNIVGINLSIMNVMGLPMIIGIGIDDGVHIMHRWRHEGLGKIRVIFSSTGKAVLLTSLTTMFAFGSMIFSGFPGWVDFGGTLALGVGTCFITTVIFLPGILGWIEKRNSIKPPRK